LQRIPLFLHSRSTITCTSSSSKFYVLYIGFPSRMSTASDRTHGCSSYCSELPDKSDCLRLNTTLEYHTLRQGAPLSVLNNSSSSCMKIIGNMDNEVTSVKANEGISHDRSTNDEKRKAIDEKKSRLTT
jgi:uncharacterized protein YpmB